MDPVLVNLFHHHRWANERVFEACLPLSEEQLAIEVPGTLGRLDETLLHLAASEGGYCRTLVRWSPPAGYGLGHGVAFPGVPLLLERVRMTGDVLIEVARSQPLGRDVTEDDTPDRPIPAWMVLLLAAYHGTDHRQQIAIQLTRLGIEPPQPDFWSFSTAVGRGEVEVEPV